MSDQQPVRVLFSASNLRVGGGVQVAASLVDEFTILAADPLVVEKHPWLRDAEYEVSPEVYNNLSAPARQTANVSVRVRRWSDPAIWLPKKKHFDVEFVVFGPRYGARRARTTVVGIADGVSIYPRPDGVDPGSRSVRLRRALRGTVSRRLFAREDFLVAESESLIVEFSRRTGYPDGQTRVVPNTVNRALLEAAERDATTDWRNRNFGDEETVFAYVARYYPHKNHRFLPMLAKELSAYNINARFLLTLTDDEWYAAPEELRAVSANAGILPVVQLVDLYRTADAVVFPSLLESFSATPVEALAINGLLFASDREFVREVCGDAAVYIDPLDASTSASVIAATLADTRLRQRLRERARGVADDLPGARDRALNMVRVIEAAINEGAHSDDPLKRS